MDKIYVIVFILIFLILNYIFIILEFNNKSFNVVGLKTDKKMPHVVSNYFNSINKSIQNLNLPFKLNTKKYLCIKYVLSITVLIITAINYKNITIALITFLVVFFSPNLLIKNCIKAQNIKLIKELKTINVSLILQLSSYVPFKDAIKQVSYQVQDKYIKESFARFAYEYEIMNFNIKKPAENIMSKFKSNELASFMQVLIQCENEGNIIENLERFNTTLDLSYFKYLNSQVVKRMTYVILGTVIMLLNIVVIAMYPILVQVMNNLQIIFS